MIKHPRNIICDFSGDKELAPISNNITLCNSVISQICIPN